MVTPRVTLRHRQVSTRHTPQRERKNSSLDRDRAQHPYTKTLQRLIGGLNQSLVETGMLVVDPWGDNFLGRVPQLIFLLEIYLPYRPSLKGNPLQLMFLVLDPPYHTHPPDTHRTKKLRFRTQPHRRSLRDRGPRLSVTGTLVMFQPLLGS